MITYCGQRNIPDGNCTYECGMSWGKGERLQCAACKHEDELDAAYKQGYTDGCNDTTGEVE